MRERTINETKSIIIPGVPCTITVTFKLYNMIFKKL